MKKILPIIISAIVIIISAGILMNKKPDLSGMTFKVASSVDLAGGSYEEGAMKFAEEFGCSVEFTDNFEESDLFFSGGEDFSLCQPIGKYININSRLYTREIIERSCMSEGEVYGITHALMGNLNYCTYRPIQFGDAVIPYEYYNQGKWTWDNFIKMADEIEENIAVDWTDSYINMQRALFLNEEGEPVFEYGTQQQVEWLNFVRTLIYDDGIVYNTEGAFKVGFLPGMILNSVGSESVMRYIPWPTKDGDMSEMFVDEYHFCVPKTAKNPKLSVKLANYMIKSCIQTREELYRANMPEEDFAILKKQLRSVYTYPYHTDYVPANRFIEDFIRGKTVTEHIYNVENDAKHIN